MRATLKPITGEEKEVMQQNYWIVEHFLEKQRLPESEWWDVVIFRYILTVERWFREPKLYHHKFITIAWKAMRSAVWNERAKQNRRLKTVSLSTHIPGTNELTYDDIITEKNLDYIPYITEAEDENYI